MCSFVAAQSTWVVDNQIVDQFSGSQNVQTLNWTFSFQKVTSCQQFESIVKDYISQLPQSYPEPILYRWWIDDVSVTQWVSVAGAQEKMVSQPVPSSTANYSTTNVQFAGVDEPEILKSDGRYVYYFNQEQRKIYVISSPLNIQTSTVDLQKVAISRIIPLPASFSNVQLFVHNKKLIIVADWYDDSRAYYYNFSARTIAIVYDMENFEKPKVLKVVDVNGSYVDARVVDWKLIFVSRIVPSFGPISYAKFAAWSQPTTTSISVEQLLPSTTDVVRTDDQSLRNVRRNWVLLDYHKITKSLSCNDIFFLLPDKETLSQYPISPSFALITQIDLGALDKAATQRMVFWEVSQLIVTPKSLLVTNSFYHSQPFACPMNARCMMSVFYWGSHTLIHKFDLAANLIYQGSLFVPGEPLNQYSIDESSQWDIRILTKTWDPLLSTNLWIADSQLKLKGKLVDIEPWEEFKSSRYLDGFLYLVTFQQIDPLFVVDLRDSVSPKIVWELKIPGYSTYLHPYAPMQNGIQYLIGIGNATDTNQRGGVTNAWVKVDLYKIDMNQKNNSGNVSVTVSSSKTFGGKGSRTEAASNPRVVVWDDFKKQLVIPMLISDPSTQQQCTVITDASWTEIKRDCSTYQTPRATFGGVKVLWITPDQGIQEKGSMDYLSELKKAQNSDEMYEWNFQQFAFRVGYFGDSLYTLTTKFGHFYLPSNIQWTSVWFDKDLGSSKPAQCYYSQPKPDQPVCEMYCGQRRIYNSDAGKCEQKEISAACQCPGFESQFSCIDNCEK